MTIGSHIVLVNLKVKKIYTKVKGIEYLIIILRLRYKSWPTSRKSNMRTLLRLKT